MSYEKLALSIVLAFFTIIGVSAQITIGKTSEDKPELMDEKGLEQTLTHYDSLKNICAENIMFLKGQTLFVYGSAGQKAAGFPRTFYTSKREGNFYGTADGALRGVRPPAENLYMARSGNLNFCTRFEAVAGKYYLIKDVFPDESQYSYYNLLLEDIDTKENIYMYVEGNSKEECEGCLILGYYEKLKQMYVGKTFRALKDRAFTKYNSDGKLEVAKGTLFECTDIAVNIGQSLYLVLTNEDLGPICSVMKSDGTFLGTMETSKYNFLVEKWGEYNLQLILEKKVCRGMTKEMAIESWGKPDHINTTTGSFGVHEQWVYKGHSSDKYLYFEDGILTTIQN